ncbi:MAG TPA: hypothetical protein VKW04_19325 [Planctomycetota bacterium]|nr:hypothetical protein [Planctomycetota bacterium]
MAAEGSLLLLEEYFASGDPRFRSELFGLNAPKKSGAFAEKWFKDLRPWARAELHDFLLDRSSRRFMALERADLKPLVKRLFKLAEAAGDHRVMAWFLVSVDRSIRREEVSHYDWPSRSFVPSLRHDFPGKGDGEAFTVRTRHYLRRRAWRYFRRLGFRDPTRYVAAALDALVEVAPVDVDSGVHLLDNWGLTHILFHHSPILRRQTNGWFVKDGASLRDLKPAPAFAAAWDAESIYRLLLKAGARPLRRTARAMLRARPALLEKVPFVRVFEMLDHPDDEIRALGLELLGSAAGLESAPLDSWNRLLASPNLDILDAVCTVMAKLVSPQGFSTEQLFAFAAGPVGPVARLGLGWLRQRDLPVPDLLRLSQVRAPAAATDAVALARERLSAQADFNPEWLLPFLDSGVREVRGAAWTWFSEEKRARHRLDLWAKIVETPYDDIRMAIIGHLERFAEMDTALRVLLARAPLETVWATVLLNIHRGNRAKRLAAGQIAAAIEREPARAPQFLPLLAIAARSIRAPEFRAGLAALVRAATRRPEIADQVARHFPELTLAP